MFAIIILSLPLLLPLPTALIAGAAPLASLAAL